MKKSKIDVVFFRDLKFSHVVDDLQFEHVSYGDAEYTLVTPLKLISELTDWKSVSGKKLEDLEGLIQELKSIPAAYLVALDG